MKRRNAMIRLLAVLAAALQPVKPQDPTRLSATVNLGRHQHLTLALVDQGDTEAYGIDHITVEYQGRRVEITAKEIMEALEGK